VEAGIKRRKEKEFGATDVMAIGSGGLITTTAKTYLKKG